MEESPMEYVRFYFDPWLDRTRRLSNEQAGRLFKAVLEYAATNGKTEPDFKDDNDLAAIWSIERRSLNRRMNRLRTRREWRKYAAYRRRCMKKNALFLSPEGWKEAGCPEA